MAISLGEVISRFAPKLTRPTEPSIYSGLEKLVANYGISLDSLDPNPESGITRIETPTGDFDIYWKERAIVPLPKTSWSG